MAMSHELGTSQNSSILPQSDSLIELKVNFSPEFTSLVQELSDTVNQHTSTIHMLSDSITSLRMMLKNIQHDVTSIKSNMQSFIGTTYPNDALNVKNLIMTQSSELSETLRAEERNKANQLRLEVIEQHRQLHQLISTNTQAEVSALEAKLDQKVKQIEDRYELWRQHLEETSQTRHTKLHETMTQLQDDISTLSGRLASTLDCPDACEVVSESLGELMLRESDASFSRSLRAETQESSAKTTACPTSTINSTHRSSFTHSGERRVDDCNPSASGRSGSDQQAPHRSEQAHNSVPTATSGLFVSKHEFIEWCESVNRERHSGLQFIHTRMDALQATMDRNYITRSHLNTALVQEVKQNGLLVQPLKEFVGEVLKQIMSDCSKNHGPESVDTPC